MQYNLSLLLHDTGDGGAPPVVPVARVKAPPNGGRWSDHEHRLFLQGLELYGRDWRRIARLVQTRTTVQTRSHAQKHFDRIEKERKDPELSPERISAKAKAAKPRPGKPAISGVKVPSMHCFHLSPPAYETPKQSASWVHRQNHVVCQNEVDIGDDSRPPVKTDLDDFLDELPVHDFLAMLTNEKEQNVMDEFDFGSLDDLDTRLTTPTGTQFSTLVTADAPSISPVRQRDTGISCLLWDSSRPLEDELHSMIGLED
ncbi:hypothetical protein ACHHYP_07251 [Achlya hypogyna]|uniref:Uncharacterized protein n=1 Tax=Achlya hypogyna TaxID=1202772 RepID=A0A1V9ZMB8_ACHHY|nr:hypothetical protein ACHHYP_07251 [Achlya hypogyna]